MSNYDYDGKHLSTTQRIKIEKGLIDAQSFASIARTIGKHPSTVSKEVKKYRYFPERNEPKNLITCARKKICQLRFLCDKKDCVKLCKFCYSADCNRDCRTICPAYESTICSKIKKLLMFVMVVLNLKDAIYNMLFTLHNKLMNLLMIF
uniref:helix-turn-helix domain-containing protein n=1 Tax=Clostridium felsineum TaxID=36839 RepID=UPI002033E52A|nr:helix-turn-helix domain-containing protein [Clostridium felsineum]